jgi:ATP-dependent helicase HrpA
MPNRTNRPPSHGRAAQRSRATRAPRPREVAAPPISYPPELPVAQRRDEIAAAIRDHQVVVVAGETGSGKTTQLPKICLELGRGVAGLIGHTQPRRIAARSVAERIAEELAVPLGDAIGYSVRFTDRVGPSTMVRLMTDGIMLAEIQRDRDLRAYDTIIVDEAHERSLNIDFLLGYLASLLPRRPDLKVVITSATIDTARFAAHFGGAPVVEVTGRTYPVEVRYQPLVDPDRPAADEREAVDIVAGIVAAVDELRAEGPGDVLVFLSGEREIRDTADALRGHLRGAREEVEVLPLYARLSAAEQHRVFERHSARRVVLATNVAETSLTVPGIRYVVDPGTARISRFSHRLKVQRLPIERVSRASADQRAGRCGRTSDGICIRLYAEEDYAARPEFTEPEILRTNLASVILQMTALGLGDLAAFPFVEPPDRRQVKDGIDLLHELGALQPRRAGDRTDGPRRLTPVGRTLARLPVDPRLGRMLLEADRNGCVPDVLVIVAAMSIQDPRERPAEHQQAADTSHRRFADDRSDFLAYRNLWGYLQEQQKALSGNAFRRMCRTEFLHYLRIREWQDLVGQLRQVAKSLGLRTTGEVGSPGDEPKPVHLSLLAGLLSHIGLWDPDRREYAGARGAHFAAWPGSGLFKKPPAWVMAGELVETSRLWGRDLGRIEPEWVEPLAEHLVKRTWSEPHWSAKQGAVTAYERVTLYGVPIVASRRVTYGRIDPVLSRELFIRHALVQGEWRTHHRFFHRNRELLEDVEELEHRARRRDILVDDDTLFDFYDARVPADVVSARHFDAWWKKARRETPDLLTFEPEMLVREGASRVSDADFPDEWVQGDVRLPLTYQFEPGTDADGVTVHVPVAALNRLTPAGFDWQVPGLRLEVLTALLRTLPKDLRKQFVPAPDTAQALLERLGSDVGDRPLTDAMGDELFAMTRVDVPPDAWDLAKVPPHLRMTFRVEDATGTTVGEGKDLTALSARLAPAVRRTVAAAAASVERRGLTGWSFGELPTTFEEQRDGQRVAGHPALVDQGSSVALLVLGSADEARRATRLGVRRLLTLTVPWPVKHVVARLDARQKLALGHSAYATVPDLLADCVDAAVDVLVQRAGSAPGADREPDTEVRDQAGFERLRDVVRGDLADATYEVVISVADVLALAHEVTTRTSGPTSPAGLPTVVEVRDHVAALTRRGFVSATGAGRLSDLRRYLRADGVRLDTLPAGAARDRARLEEVRAVTAEVEKWVSVLAAARRADPAAVEADPEITAVRWMVEELRVSLFAQQLGTKHPVSAKRIYRAMDTVG